MISGLLASLLLAAAPECSPPKAGEPIVLLVVAGDPGLARSVPAVERAVRSAARGKLELLPADATTRALTIEGGSEEREAAVIEARVWIGRAEDRFRELDDEESLSLLAKAIARLTSAHQEPGAVALIAHAHFLAGAIYLARGRTDAARQRIMRALDLEPQLAPARDRFAPEALAELAAVRAERAARPAGRLVIRTAGVTATVFIDGREAGTTPLELDTIPAGNHLLRVAARGRSSHTESIQIAAAEEVIRELTLAPDPELATIAALEKNTRPALELIARRARAKRTLFAQMGLGGGLSRSGTATIGVDLQLLGAGSAYAASLDRAELDRALASMLDCSGVRRGTILAPSSFGLISARISDPAPVPDPVPVWERSWFWALTALATIAVSGAFVVARTSGGPPETVELRLIPRP